MPNTYPKNEKLKSRKLIDSLFSDGQSVSKYPLRLVFRVVPEADEPLQLGVSVSKKYFKKAVDRNYYKRLLRESYRQNKQLLGGHLPQPLACMLFYQTKDRLDFHQIDALMVQLLAKFVAKATQAGQGNTEVHGQ